MSQNSQTGTESGYIREYSDASANLPDRSVVTLRVPAVNATSLGTTLPVNSPRFHQEDVSFMGLIRFLFFIL